jgi:hypothetical protein
VPIKTATGGLLAVPTAMSMCWVWQIGFLGLGRCPGPAEKRKQTARGVTSNTLTSRCHSKNGCTAPRLKALVEIAQVTLRRLGELFPLNHPILCTTSGCSAPTETYACMGVPFTPTWCAA